MLFIYIFRVYSSCPSHFSCSTHFVSTLTDRISQPWYRYWLNSQKKHAFKMPDAVGHGHLHSSCLQTTQALYNVCHIHQLTHPLRHRWLQGCRTWSYLPIGSDTALPIQSTPWYLSALSFTNSHTSIKTAIGGILGFMSKCYSNPSGQHTLPP